MLERLVREEEARLQAITVSDLVPGWTLALLFVFSERRAEKLHSHEGIPSLQEGGARPALQNLSEL